MKEHAHPASTCPRCSAHFTCRRDEIGNCDCKKIILAKIDLEYIAENYHSCLCNDCLEQIRSGEKNSFRRVTLGVFVFCFFLFVAKAQIYPPGAGQPGSTAIHKDSIIFRDWVKVCTAVRGYQDISNPNLGKVSAGDESMVIGKALSNGVISLGDGGIATCGFNAPIRNGPGFDFVVFENSFDGSFLEFAFVEVSSDGQNFFRFSAASLVDTTTQVGTFDNTDPSKINNLAGKYIAGYGTPFDLEELKNIQGLDVNNVTQVRLIDVVGCIQNSFCTRDASGRKINDPWPTAFAQGGFDLDAIGVIHSASTLGIKSQDFTGNVFLPGILSRHEEFIIHADDLIAISILDLSGRIIKTVNNDHLSALELQVGLYLIQAVFQEKTITKKILIY